MRQRSISAIGIVVLGLAPAFVGGPVFAAAFTLIALQSFRELVPLVGLGRRDLVALANVAILLAGVLTWLEPKGRFLPLVLALAILGPLALAVVRHPNPADRQDWAATAGATLYLLLPTVGAIGIRGMEGNVDRVWFQNFSNAMPFNGERTAEGLAWFLTVLLISWLSDTCAYLVGRSVGRTRLIPAVSPNKTVEGAIGGFIAAGMTAVMCVMAFGLALHPLVALLLGVALGAIGLIGDLGESVLKRRAGVKDSGTLIPGHGGMLDRIDALIFVLVAAWALMPFVA